MRRSTLALVLLAAGLCASAASAGKLTTGAVYSSGDLTKCRILNAGLEPVEVSIWVMNADTGAVVASTIANVQPMRHAMQSFSGTAPYFCRFQFLGPKTAMRGSLEQTIAGDVATTLEAR